MRKITLELHKIESEKAMHIYLAYMLDLPSYYGRNLDALYDMLGEISDPTELTLLCGDAVWTDRLVGVFEDAAEENPNLTVNTCEA